MMKKVLGWLVAGAVVGALFAFMAGRAQAFVCDAEPHKVEQGDTLWAIAEKKCDGNLETVTDNLVETYGTIIHAGQTIWLPTNQNCLLVNRGGDIYDECG